MSRKASPLSAGVCISAGLFAEAKSNGRTTKATKIRPTSAIPPTIEATLMIFKVASAKWFVACAHVLEQGDRGN